MRENPYDPPAPLEATLVDAPGLAYSAAESRQATGWFRSLLLLYAAMTAASIVAAFSLESFLPEELRLYEEGQVDAVFTGPMIAVTMLALFALVLDVVGWLGLMLFWRPARWIFLAAHLLFLVVIGLFGPTVSHSITDATDTAAGLSAGAILAMAFFSPVRERFARKPLS